MSLSRRKFLGVLAALPFIAKAALVKQPPPIVIGYDPGAVATPWCVIKPVTRDYVLRSVSYPWPEGKHVIYDGATGEVSIEDRTP